MHRLRAIRLTVAYLALLLVWCLPASAQPLAQAAEQVRQLLQSGQPEKALPLARQLSERCRTELGAAALDTGSSLVLLGDVQAALGKDHQAVETYLQGFKIQRAAVGLAHPATVETLAALSQAYHRLRDYAAALQYRSLRHQVYLQELGPDHLKTVRQLPLLAGIYQDMGRFDEAEEHFLKGIAALRRLEPRGQMLAVSLNNLAVLYESRGDYARASSTFRESVQLNTDIFGSDSEQVAIALRMLGHALKNDEKLSEATEIMLQALSLRKNLGHPAGLALALLDLAQVYELAGRYADMKTPLERAVALLEEHFGKHHRETAMARLSLAGYHRRVGDFAAAEAALQRAETGLKSPQDRYFLHSNLAVLYKHMGDFGRALQHRTESLQMAVTQLGEAHPTAGGEMNELGLLLNRMQAYKRASEVLERALSNYRTAFGPDHRRTHQVATNLATAYAQSGRAELAEPLLSAALAHYETQLGTDERETCLVRRSLAELKRQQGDYANAEALHRSSMRALLSKYGESQPELEYCYEDLIRTQLDAEKISDGLNLALRRQSLLRHKAANILSFTSERERLAFQASFHPYYLLAALAETPSLRSEAVEQLAGAVFGYKGIVLDSMVEDAQLARAAGDPALRAKIEEIRRVTRQLQQQRESGHSVVELNLKLEELQGQLAREATSLTRSRRALEATVAKVQSAIPEGSVLVDLVRYQRYDRNSVVTWCYGAIVLPADGAPDWVVLGTEKDLARLVLRYQRKFARDGAEASQVRVLTEGYQRLFAPLEERFPPGTQRVLLAPDGRLNFISFATLLTPDDKFLAEKYSLRYLTSGRDLLLESAATTQKNLLAFGNPDYGGAAGNTRVSFVPLPGTELECQTLGELAPTLGWKPLVKLGSEATEASLRTLAESPFILHLATHGFFLPPPKTAKAGSPLLNGMRRSGLALVGAETTIEKWRAGTVPESGNDGILDAQEAGLLKLRGTWLTTLSACDTGKGEVTFDGIMGLRRGFVIAGTKNLLLTLWPVSDEATQKIMLDFYRRAATDLDAPAALAEVQREWLVKLRDQDGVGAAVRLAGPFVLNFRGSL